MSEKDKSRFTGEYEFISHEDITEEELEKIKKYLKKGEPEEGRDEE